jgi:hypothetical protein
MLFSMSPWDERTFRNEALFREVNAHIADLEERLSQGVLPEPLALVCECSRTGCMTQIEVERPTFEQVRENPMRFLVAPGHEDPDVETVVARRDGYVIVEKRED